MVNIMDGTVLFFLLFYHLFPSCGLGLACFASDGLSPAGYVSPSKQKAPTPPCQQAQKSTPHPHMHRPPLIQQLHCTLGVDLTSADWLWLQAERGLADIPPHRHSDRQISECLAIQKLSPIC